MTPELPRAPEGWNKTLDDLLADASLKPPGTGIGWPETEWARNFELSLLPPGTRFPRHGDIYAANEPVATTLFLDRMEDVRYTLPAGTKIRVESLTSDSPVAVTVLPVEYKAIKKSALSVWTRFQLGFGGYHLSMATLELNTRFTLVSSDA